MTEAEGRLEALLRSGHPDEDHYHPPGLTLTSDAVASVATTRVLDHPRRRPSMGRTPWLYPAIAASLALVVVLVGVQLMPQTESTIAGGPTVEDALATLRGHGLHDPSIVGQASSGDHSVFLFDAFVPESSGFRRSTYGYQTFAGHVPLEMGREEGRRPPDFVGIVGTTIGGVDDVTTVEAGFLIGLVPDERVQRVVVLTELGDRLEEPVSGPAFMVALPETFHPELEIEWRLLDAQGSVLYGEVVYRGPPRDTAPSPAES